ncbi:MAG: hypothetical protein GY804_06090 [Alphaproteobacteria bacterium]|nr:hypothetical protein [Alphaproteobacteria bacterium]
MKKIIKQKKKYYMGMVYTKQVNNVPLLKKCGHASLLLGKEGDSGKEEELVSFYPKAEKISQFCSGVKSFLCGSSGFIFSTAVSVAVDQFSGVSIPAEPMVAGGSAVLAALWGHRQKGEIRNEQREELGPEIADNLETIKIPVTKEQYESAKNAIKDKGEFKYNFGFSNCADFVGNLLRKHSGLEIPKKLIQTPKNLAKDVKNALGVIPEPPEVLVKQENPAINFKKMCGNEMG